MSFGFLSPGAALVGLCALVALVLLAMAERRSRRVARAIGLAPARWRGALPVAAALAATGGIVALAAAQPVVSEVREKSARTDAEVVFVFDITRSMLASTAPGEPARFARQKEDAKTIRSAMPEVPVGVASLSDRLLPHLFPSASLNTFTSTVDRALGIERPPPDRSRRGVATAFTALTTLATQNYYGDAIPRRVAVVFTDGESSAFDAPSVSGPLKRARITPFFVHFWSPEERVYRANGEIERYRPEPGTDLRLRSVASNLGGAAFDEGDVEQVTEAIREAIGEGTLGTYGAELQTRTLSAYILPFAVLPLAFVLWRRNF